MNINDAIQGYKDTCTKNGIMFALEFEENEVYSIGSTFEALVKDFCCSTGYEFWDTTSEQIECFKSFLNSIECYCLDDNDADFYGNVEKAINEVTEAL